MANNILRTATDNNDERMYSAEYVFPNYINPQDLYNGTYTHSNMQFDILGSILVWKNNALYEVSTGIKRYYLQNNLFVLL